MIKRVVMVAWQEGLYSLYSVYTCRMMEYSKIYKYKKRRCTSVSASKHAYSRQHHDGITGTAKDKVTVDYGNKLVTSMMKAKEVMVATSQYLIANSLGIDGPGE